MRLAVCNGDLKTASKASQTGMAAGNPANATQLNHLVWEFVTIRLHQS
jgi:hypothetical protein